MKQHSVPPQVGIANPGGTTRGDLPAEFAGLARLARGIARTCSASIVLTGVGELWCGSESDRSSLPGHADWPLRAAAGEVLGALAVHHTARLDLSDEQQGLLAELARQCTASALLHARIAELELLHRAQAPSPPATGALPYEVLDSAPAALYYVDAARGVDYCNAEYRRIFGLRPDQRPNEWAQGLHPEDLDRIKRGWAEYVSRPRSMAFEYRARPDGGAVRFYSEHVQPLGGEGYIGTISDVTDLVTARSDLHKQSTLLEAVISDLPVGLLACDVSGIITHCNRAAAALHGMQPDELGASISASLTADIYLMDGVTALPEKERPLARALRGETISNLELTVVPAEAPPRTTLSSARRLLGPEGQVLGAVAVIQDTTERKAREMELERVHKELVTASREAGMAEVATNVLHNVGNILNSVNISASLVAERLRQSKAAGVSRLAAMLVEQGERAGQFIAEDARGKRVPEYLAALGAQLQNDQRAALEELALLRENLEHIKDTVNMQQSYARLCGVTETIEVADLVEDSLRLNAGAFERHGVALCREFVQVPTIQVDKHKVLQILVNLVRNAKYACDDSGRSDKLITLKIAPLRAGVSITVQDNGIGIPAQNLPRLFQHGFTTRASGHGFGLHSGAIAAQELGGALRAESEGEGRGSAFTLELPLSPPIRAPKP
jgi:PAS domain S-box-containing protein